MFPFSCLFHIFVTIALYAFFMEKWLPNDALGFLTTMNYLGASLLIAGTSYVAPKRLYIRFCALFNFVFFGFIPLYLQQSGTGFNHLVAFSADIQTRAIGGVFVSQVAFLIGYFVAKRFNVELPGNFMGKIGNQLWEVPSLQLIAILGVTLTVIGIIIVGGPEELLLSRNEFSKAFDDGFKGIFKLKKLLIGAPIATATIIVLSRLASGEMRITLGSMLGFSLLLFLCLLANNPIYQSRFWSGTVFCSLLLCYARHQMPDAVRWAPGIAALFLLFIFPFVDVFRRSTDASIVKRITDSRGIGAEFSDKGDFSMYLQQLSIIQLVEDRGHDHGKQILGACLFWVPRTIWEDKPISTGAEIAKEYGLRQEKLATPLVCEFYYAFGTIGIAVGFFFLGFAVLAIDNTLTDPYEDRSPNLIHLLILLCPLILMLLRGSLTVAIGNLTYALMFYSVVVGGSAFLTNVLMVDRRRKQASLRR